MILDNSVIGRSPVKAGRQMGEDIRKSKYCPSWLQIDFRAEYVYTEIEVSDSDKANVVSSFKGIKLVFLRNCAYLLFKLDLRYFHVKLH